MMFGSQSQYFLNFLNSQALHISAVSPLSQTDDNNSNSINTTTRHFRAKTSASVFSSSVTKISLFCGVCVFLERLEVVNFSKALNISAAVQLKHRLKKTPTTKSRLKTML